MAYESKNIFERISSESESESSISFPLDFHLSSSEDEEIVLDDKFDETYKDPKEIDSAELNLLAKIKKIQCSLCGEVFTNKVKLDHHLLEHTGLKEFSLNYKSADKQIEKPYKCDLCNKTYKTRESYLIHKREHSVDNLFQCEICKVYFRHKEQFLEHKEKHVSLNLKSFCCHYCNKTFRDKSKMTEHVDKVHIKMETVDETHLVDTNKSANSIQVMQKPYTCVLCGKTFLSSQGVIQHIKVHSGENQKFTCFECGKKFTQQSSLKLHSRMHSGEKLYKCEYCDKEFSISDHYTKHLRVHTKEKPYQCNVCLKRFTQSNTVTQHMRIHTGEKPYRCNICDKHFRLQVRHFFISLRIISYFFSL